MSHSSEPRPMTARRSGPLRGVAQVPGDKSISHRALILGGMAEGVTEIEVARSKRQVTAGALLALDGLGAAPRMFGHVLSVGLGPEVVEFWPTRIRAVTDAQVAAAARSVFTHPSITGWLLPEGVSAS